MLIGAHVSIRGGIDNAVDNAVRIGADVIQTHPTSAVQWQPLRLDDAVLARYVEKYTNAQLRGHWLHAVYLINLATGKEELLRQSIGSLLHYMEIAKILHADGVVFHPGSHLGAGFGAALPQMHDAIKEVLDRTDSPAKLLVENSAGSGGCVGCTFTEVGRIVHPIDDPRLGVCLDTQHLFASGYDIRTEATTHATLAAFDRDVGFDTLALIHANDSRRELGCNVDRHANIGEGEIGAEAFTFLAGDSRMRGVPWLLEVPGQNRKGPDVQQINLLRDCANAARALHTHR